MRVQCQQEHLLHEVQTVSRAISSRASMPILGNLLLEASQNSLKITATDLELGIESRISADVVEPGSMTLPARIFSDIVSNLPQSTVTLDVTEGDTKTRINCENIKFEILGLPAADFPLIPADGGEVVARIDAGLFRTMIRQTSFAVSTDETRPFLTGVYVMLENGGARLVATDGGRLALRTAKLAGATKGKIAAIVPSKTMGELVRALGGIEGELAVASHENQLIFTVAGMRFVSRLIAGQFPAYEKVIPAEFTQRIRVGTEQLLRAVRRASITARDSANVVRLSAAERTLTITSNTPEVGKAQEDIEVRAEGETVQVAFNAKFLLDALANMDTPDVSFELTGSLSPGVLRPVDHTDYLYVLAPVRVYG
jgi:DNA polymerase III subunit beta